MADGDRSRRVSLYGLAAVVVAFVAIGSMHALQQPPFAAPDEGAQLGYAHAVARLDLPAIDTLPRVPESATLWRADRESAPTQRHRGVWVANHPPLHYALVAPLVWIAELTDRPDGGLLFLRLANVGFAALGVALTYLLALELTGLRRIALLAAAAAAMTTQAHVLFSSGLNDGLAFAAGTAVVWAGVRCLQRGAGGRRLALLGAAAAVAAGARTATMILAIAVVGAVAADAFTRCSGAARRRAAGRALAAGLIPAAVVFGWFYVRNVVRYGDVGASRHLMEWFHRTPRGSVLSIMDDGNEWRIVYERLMAPDATTIRNFPLMLLVGALAVVGLIAVVVTRQIGDLDDHRQPATVSRRSIALLVLSVVVIAITFAQHVSAGGTPYPRYLLPALGVMATLVVVGLDRLAPRVLPVALVVAMAWWSLLHVPVAVDPTRVIRSRDDGRPPELLQVLPTGPLWRAFAGCWIVIGCAVALAAILHGWVARVPVASSDATDPAARPEGVSVPATEHS